MKNGKHLGPVHRRNKFQFKTEDKALQSILDKNPSERKNNLDAVHTEKQWVWKAKTNFD